MIPVLLDKNASGAESRVFSIHGQDVELNSACAPLQPAIERVLRPFAGPRVLLGRLARGILRPFDEAQVIPTLSNSARRVERFPWLELHQDGRQFWLVDESWGIVEVHFGRNYWRSWILPNTREDPLRLAEKAVLWPMAQLLRGRGVHLVPAPSVARDGVGILLLTGYSLEPELTRLAAAGYRIIGQRWTALRQENGRVKLLHLPGAVQRCAMPRRYTEQPALTSSHWVDLEEEFPGSSVQSAWCDLALVVEARHRSAATASPLPAPLAHARLRRVWPMIDLRVRPPHDVIAALARTCTCAQTQLSRRPDDFRMLLDSLVEEAPASQVRSLLSA